MVLLGDREQNIKTQEFAFKDTKTIIKKIPPRQTSGNLSVNLYTNSQSSIHTVSSESLKHIVKKHTNLKVITNQRSSILKVKPMSPSKN